MSDNENQDSGKQFSIDRAKQSLAKCKHCKEKCMAGEIRIAKIGPNPFGEGTMKSYFHLKCIFEKFLKQRPTTARIQSSDDIDGWGDIPSEDQEKVEKIIDEYNKLICDKYKLPLPKKPTKSPKKPIPDRTAANIDNTSDDNSMAKLSSVSFDPNSNFVDYPFKEFRRVVANITNVSSYIQKTNIVNKFFIEGPDGTGFKGNLVTWCRLLLPGVIKRVYNLQSKVLVKIFSKIFDVNHDDMLEHLEQGNIGETIEVFFGKSTSLQPCKKSKLTLDEVDNFLEELSKLTKHDEQTHQLKKIAQKCTLNDLKVIIRLIKHDLRMNAGAKHILDGVHPQAYTAYQSCRDINAVIRKCLISTKTNHSTIKTPIALMTPVLPMLAEACKSVEYAFKKCPNGMYSEIKYDGERVQVHKMGSEYKYFSRSLKPVMPHKIAYFKDYIPKAFPKGEDLILDCEILMVDSSGNPLPFGTLGVHKKNQFKDATVCLFVFDCIYYNGDILTSRPLNERKKILEKVMKPIPNHIMFSEAEIIFKSVDLFQMIAKVLKQGLEGLVLKDLNSIYEPGKRHWLKVKKDYLFGGAIADSADLIVLGAWYGTGKKGGIMSVFLMGCYDKAKKVFCTVTKVHTGHDDKTLERLQGELDMVKISGDINKVPSWLKCTKTMVPDFVAADPKKQPVWEITGAEFTCHDVHTADGISIRFPRVTKIRDDKNWETATNLEELKVLVENSKHVDVNSLGKNISDIDISNSKSPLQIKQTSPSCSSPKKKSPKKRPNQTDSIDEEECSPKRFKKDPEVDILKPVLKNPLPDVFDSLILLVDEDAKSCFEKWSRYFIAYGGTIVGSDEADKCNYVLHKRESVEKPTIKCPVHAKHVFIDWIEHSVKSKKLLDYRKYAVSIKPPK